VFAAAVTAPLSVTSVKVTDNKHIRINFSEAIDSDSVVLKVMKQSDNSTIKLDALTAVTDSPQSVDVTLDDVLVEASSYTLTVIAGIGVSGATITDGASALQDFITPSPLKIA
jgi:methionine-rich copper-binding protein CopC